MWNYYRLHAIPYDYGYKKDLVLLLNDKLRDIRIDKISNKNLTVDKKAFYMKEITHHIYDNIETIPLEIGLFRGDNGREYKYTISVNSGIIPHILYAELNSFDIYFDKFENNNCFKFVNKKEIPNIKKREKRITLKTYKIRLLNNTRFNW